MPVKKKVGSISQSDRAFIIKNIDVMSAEDMATQLNRNVAVVEGVIKGHSALPDASEKSIRWQLMHSSHWKHLRQEFTEDELNKIADQYVKYVEQFSKDGIIATEEVQILNLIKIEILSDRNLKGKMGLSSTIKGYEDIIENILSKVDGDWHALTEREQDQIMKLKEDIQSALRAETTRTNEYVELQKQHTVLTEKVMGSRDQRVKEVLNQKISFLGIVKQLMDEEKQKKESRMLELYNKGVAKEYERLIQPHKYEDGVTDNPILCSDVVEKLDTEDVVEMPEIVIEENNGHDTTVRTF